MTQLDLFDTLTKARMDLGYKLDEGTVCPCCDQFAKRYRRKFNSGMARLAITLLHSRARGQAWTHVSQLASVSREVYQLGWWGLVDERPREEDDQGKRTSGWWRLTPRGIAFAANTLMVHSYAVVYNRVCERVEGDRITVRNALGVHFDYDELIAARPGDSVTK